MSETRRVIVIGGSGALGQVLCKELAGEGARVGFTFFQNEAAARALCEANAAAFSERLDCVRPGEVERVIDALAARLGGVDALVYAAATGSTRTPAGFDRMADVTEEGFDRLFALNVRGAFFALRRAASHFGDRGGNVVLLGSVDGVKPVPAPIPYAASKGALSALATSASKELGKRNVRINVVAPGVLEAGASSTLPEELRAEYLKHCGLRRYGTLLEAAKLVAFFALHNTYVTGRTMVLDGGL
jgi:3-oxoacyl-[acyl-carrier protein] reductase